uniref:Mannosyl-glycoprotein endo-beta-N-acetylglucosaminidase n=1 Tax=Macrostomum lignano TaxID=282301 RepID=A0A1I8FE20_9PLAT
LTQFPALVHSLQIPCHSTSPTATASGSSLDAYSSDSSEEEILDPEVSVATCCSQSRAATVREKPRNPMTAEQVSKPIKSLNELAAWRPGQTVRQPSALAPREDLPTSSPRVLVCHDMQGGYLDDAYLYGNANASAFRLFHWHLIDSFVYFSHHLVTIPPAGWVDLCHRHGVPCLGTFIAEWDSGLEAMRQLLSNEKDAIGWADRLIDLADAGGFDGWLINVEVALPAELVPALQAFVRRLKSKSSLHIVWYDSVITDGQLLMAEQRQCVERRLPDSGSRLNPVELLLDCRLVEVYSRQAGRASVVVLFGSNRLCRRRLLRPWLPRRRRLQLLGGCANDCRESAAGRWTVRARLGLTRPADRRLNQTKPMETRANLWESLVDRTLGVLGRHDSTAGRTPALAGRRLNTAFCLGQGVCKWDRGRLVSTNAWNSLRTPMPHYWLCGAEQHLSLCRSRAWQGGGCLRVAPERRVGGGIGGNGGCELPLFRLSLPARQVRALKLVYSLDSVFEDRPLDPVTVCLVAKYRGHSSVSILSAGSHYSVGSGGGSSQTLVFPRTVRREVEGDAYSEAGGAAGHGGVVWHMVYTEAAAARF